MEVGQEHMDRPAIAREAQPGAPDPSASIQDEDRPVSTVDLEAGRVSAVADRVGTGARERPALAPDGDPHQGWAMWPPALSMGIAVA